MKKFKINITPYGEELYQLNLKSGGLHFWKFITNEKL